MKLQKLEELERIWRDCARCPLSMSRNRIVQWRGSPDAPLFIITEAPGVEEDRTGFPFVGPTGRLFDEILEEAYLDRTSDVFIANIVGCRPIADRLPTSDEVAACYPRLMEMVEIVEPKCALVLGATAGQTMLNALSVEALRGQVLDVSKHWQLETAFPVPAVLTYHPSQLLYEDFARTSLRRRGIMKQMRKHMISDIELAWDVANGNT